MNQRTAKKLRRLARETGAKVRQEVQVAASVAIQERTDALERVWRQRLAQLKPRPRPRWCPRWLWRRAVAFIVPAWREHVTTS